MSDHSTLEEIATIPLSNPERRLTGNLPCPICGEWGGFHNDDIHRQNIDPKYLKEKGWHNAS